MLETASEKASKSKVSKKKFCIVKQKLTIYKDVGNFRIYPSEIFPQLKKKDRLKNIVLINILYNLNNEG